ncbi:hypothetical protein OG948_42300 (plasmid) [Embleya sp. NBC_00888]|uniref:hypothetical protein n=1 Tax=Embleya sp. NBC_00888 TaxID=2975960 RepID=UPI002F906E37|nr:hypothetical protein OG948_42300 [Embleya sp. NBC_00888]
MDLRGDFLHHVIEDSPAAVMVVDAASLPHPAALDLSERLRTPWWPVTTPPP